MRPDSRITRNVLPMIPAAGRENAMNKENHRNILFLITYTVILILISLQQVEGNLIYPKVVGNSVGLPGIWVLMAVTIGGSAMGVVGMLVMIPACSVIYSLLRTATRLKLREKGVEREKYLPDAPKAK